MLISLLIVVIILGLIVYLIQMLPIEQPFKTIALAIVILVAVLYLLHSIGWNGVAHASLELFGPA